MVSPFSNTYFALLSFKHTKPTETYVLSTRDENMLMDNPSLIYVRNYPKRDMRFIFYPKVYKNL